MRLFTTLLFLTLVAVGTAQPPCPNPSDVSLVVTIRTDSYGYETSWQIVGSSGTVYHQVNQGTYANNQTFQKQVCVPENECVSFNIYDSYGDGIFSPGFFLVTLNGDTVAMGHDFGHGTSFNFNCAAGQMCTTAEPVTEGIYTTTYDNHFYSFSPDSIGLYKITTCGLDSCDTKIWVYDNCSGNGLSEENAGTVFYDNDESDCAPQAEVLAYMDPNKTYIIRIGDNENACGDSLTWQIIYLGPVVGCMDPTACNYNPLASIDDGTCIPQGSPDCPDGPDLRLREDILRSSLSLSTITSNDGCLIQEGCIKGYGTRDVVRFSTRIENIGEKDYYIGIPAQSNPQFTWNNCHNHFHYDGYAEYLLFDENGNKIPAGFKNGFCVLDLGCYTGGGQYGCGNMGISAGCYDEYWSGLSCQWVDVTDVPDGHYVLVTRVNWDNAPDALGQVEKDTLNNWGQVCLNLDRSSGELIMTIDDTCEPLVDCAGTPYGSSQLDCNGVCGGTSLRGDIDENGSQEMLDASTYVDMILAGDIQASPCTDLNADDIISVYDAALLASCLNFGTQHIHTGQTIHNHCNFPFGISNPLDTATFTILDANFDEQYIDIGITNPNDYINAYHFQMSGISIMNVENLVDPAVYPITPRANIDQGMIIGISYEDSLIVKSPEVQPLCRIYFNEITADYICIDQVIDVVNGNNEQIRSKIVDGCVAIPVGVHNISAQLPVTFQPNPMNNSALLRFPNPMGRTFQLEVMDAQGRLVRRYSNITSSEVSIERQSLSGGMYFYRLHGEGGSAVGRFAIE